MALLITGAKAIAVHAPRNFQRLLRLVYLSVPLLFAKIADSRAMISRDNLVSFIHCCIITPVAAGETFLIVGQHSLSTPALIKTLV